MRRQKRDNLELVALIVLVLGAAALMAACVPQQPTNPTPTEINITNTNTNTQGGGNGPGGGASPSPGTCGAVTEVTNGLLGAGGVKEVSLRVGQSTALDVTPNKNRDEHCNAFRRVAWTVTQATEVCSISNPESYTPQVTARAPGRCVVRASVEGVAAEQPIVVTVTQ
jgi:hypothetical protein